MTNEAGSVGREIAAGTAGRRRLAAGAMTGTSVDGLDAALVEIIGDGLAMRATVLRCASRPLGACGDPLRRLARGEALTAEAICAAAYALSQVHLDALREVSAGDGLDLVALHGQTVFHAPPLSWQLLQPAPIAAALGAAVVFDLRAADLACGGQGAPITPLADYVLFGDRRERRCILNLGGFCNVTRLPRRLDHAAERNDEVEQIEGFDVCVCNQLLDRIARERLGAEYDEGGHAALRGVRDAGAEGALASLLEGQASMGRSLGTGDELAGWLAGRGAALSGGDAARTACEALAAVIARRAAGVERVVLAGGGVRNAALVGALRARVRVPIVVSDELGVPVAHREAAAMAVLGALSRDGVALTLPQVTGVPAPAPLGGAWQEMRRVPV